jgi:prepilin-type N-terminal cleavage/methylation domain-containing protein
MKTNSQHQSRGAFTLLELLVVVAIVAILASLLASAVAKGRQASQRIACISKLKQWGHGAHFYAEDHNDRLPQEAIFDGINTWEDTAFSGCKEVWYNSMPRSLGVKQAADFSRTPSSQRSFYSPTASIFHCPSARFAPVAATYPNFSLAMNSKLMGDFESNAQMDGMAGPAGGPLPPNVLRLSQIVVPTKTALFLDSGVAGERTVSEFQLPYTGMPKAYASEFPARHGKGGNILFAAGNVSTLPVREVVDMDPNSPFRGGGIFPPKGVIWRHDPALVP